jgi:hypothetical protein
MPHIALPDGLPGIVGGLAFRPETAHPLGELAEVLLRGPNTLSRGEREMIATFATTWPPRPSAKSSGRFSSSPAKCRSAERA